MIKIIVYSITLKKLKTLNRGKCCSLNVNGRKSMGKHYKDILTEQRAEFLHNEQRKEDDYSDEKIILMLIQVQQF